MTIELTRTALKNVDTLPVADAERILSALTALESLPNTRDLPGAARQIGVQVKKLKGITNAYRVRAGDWRAGFSINGDTLTVEWIRNRREAYR